MLDRVAIYKEKSELLKQKIKKAMKYPITVIVVALIVTIILMVKVVPVFQDLFSSFGANLPAFTQMVVNMSNWMQNIGLYFADCWHYYCHILRSKKTQSEIPKFSRSDSTKVPIFGDLVY